MIYCNRKREFKRNNTCLYIISLHIYIYTACFFDNNISWSLDTTIKIDQSCDLKVMGSNFENISFICSDKTVHIYASSSIRHFSYSNVELVLEFTQKNWAEEVPYTYIKRNWIICHTFIYKFPPLLFYI